MIPDGVERAGGFAMARWSMLWRKRCACGGVPAAQAAVQNYAAPMEVGGRSQSGRSHENLWLDELSKPSDKAMLEGEGASHLQ